MITYACAELCSRSVARTQYQVRLLHHTDDDGSALIYAPQDHDDYIRPSSSSKSPATMVSSRHLSQERQLLRKLEASLDSRSDDRKKMMYDKLRKRHKRAMQRIIDDVLTLGQTISST